MQKPVLRVAVIGCGSAGPAAALYLAQMGHAVELFERAPSLEPVGTGFLLQPTGLAVLDELGVLEAANQYGARVEALHSKTRGGKTLLDLRYSDLSEISHGLGMHRATLLHLLMQEVQEAGIGVHLGCEVHASQLEGKLRFLDTEQGRRGPFDLVIVANGAQSCAREWISTRTRVKRYLWGALWALVPDPERRFDGRLWQIVDGTHSMLGFLPSGTRFDDPDQAPLVSLFWSVRADRERMLRERGLDALHESIQRLEPAAQALVGSIDSMEEWAFASYWDVVMSRLDGPGLVVLGDAAHAMSPQLGQGVNLALWDARELGRTLGRSDSLEEGLAAFTRSRKRHLGFYQRATRWLTPFFQSSIPGAGLIRNALLPIAGQIPFTEREMLASMAGVKTGVFSRLDPRKDAL